MSSESPVFEETCKNYLAQVARTDIRSESEKLGVRTERDDILVPLFGRCHRISSDQIADPSGNKPAHTVNVVLCKYLLSCPGETPHADDWVSYKDFKDAAPFAGAFANNTENAIAKNFSGRLDQLRTACEHLGGYMPDTELPYDLSMVFHALPKVPILLLFNDADDEFPSQCKVLFERRAARYLDMECLAILGWLFSDYLVSMVRCSA